MTTAAADITVTFFQSYAAQQKEERCLTIADLAALIGATSARTKGDLPWLKLALFGDERSDKGSLRHDRNMLAITGVEADYDREQLGFYQAEAIAHAAGLGCILYTSPSNKPDRPRWRVLAPLSQEYPPAERGKFLAWLHGLYTTANGGGDVFSGESWTLSQSYYFGSVKRSPHHRVVIVEGACIDQLPALEQTAHGKPQSKATGGAGGGYDPGVDEDALLEQVRTSKNYHHSAIRLIGFWASHGASYREASSRIVAAFETVPAEARDQRWHDRVRDLPNLLTEVYARDAKKRTRHDADEQAFEDDHPAPGAPSPDDEDEAGWGLPAPELPWPVLDDLALHGLPGAIVAAIAPHTESDPAAILVQVLDMCGNAIGRAPHYRVEGDDHFLNLFVLLAGETSKGRKGTSLSRVRQIMKPADSDWERTRVTSGLSSGEGLIWAVRDETKKSVKNDDGILEEKIVDAGVADKRLLVIESEFAKVLACTKRDGNTLSAVMRDAWDRGNLGSLTKNSPARATGAHISVIGHITIEELRRDIDQVHLVNGFLNRFLIVCVRRARLLPFGGSLDAEVVLELADRVHFAIEAARHRERITFTAAAAELWAEKYEVLSDGHPGLFGAVIARSEAQTIRLATLYAVLDGKTAIEVPHLDAALALWAYCQISARYIFGDATGDPVADHILRALRAHAPDGMTRNAIREMFDRNRTSERIGAALGTLFKHGLVRYAQKTIGIGRPATLWFSI